MGNTRQGRRYYLLRQYTKWQQQSQTELIWIETNLAITHPRWTVQFIRNYIISRYPDIWQYHHDTRGKYYKLTEPERNNYRLGLITDNKLCDDVVREIATYF